MSLAGNPLTPSPNEPPSPYAWRLSLLLAWGQHAEAQALLDSLNAGRERMGWPLFEMPRAADTSDGLAVLPCDATARQVERELRFTMEMQGRAA